MEMLMEFLEQYWGITVFGGVTVGALIMFAYTAIRLFIRDKQKEGVINTLLTKIQEALTGNDRVKAEVEGTKENLIETFKGMQKTLQESFDRNAYYEQMMTVLFKSMSYIVVASKLPLEEKMNLTKDFNDLKETFKRLSNSNNEMSAEVKKELMNEKITKAPKQEPEKAAVQESEQPPKKEPNDMTEIVEKANSLLERYTEKA